MYLATKRLVNLEYDIDHQFLNIDLNLDEQKEVITLTKFSVANFQLHLASKLKYP